MLKNRYYFIILGILVAVVVGISLQMYNMPTRNTGSAVFTHYNNYLIFKNSFFHLSEGLNLYQAYPNEVWDLYKYAPVFSLFMGLFAWMPDWAGLICWNLLNAVVLFLGARRFDFGNRKLALFFWLFVIVELVTSLQNSQCNVLIIGLFMLAHNAFERKKMAWAALFLTLTVFIKLFGLVAFALFLLYPKKGKFILFSACFFILFAFLPIVVTGWDELVWQYGNWLELLTSDHSTSRGFSVNSWLQAWFGFESHKLAVTIIGILLFLIPLTFLKKYRDPRFRKLILASIAIWVVIFNHKAESATYIIAVVGAYIWFSASARNWPHWVLLIFCLLFTVLSPTELFPVLLKEKFVAPYVMKAVPCIVIWVAILVESIRLKPLPAVEAS